MRLTLRFQLASALKFAISYDNLVPFRYPARLAADARAGTACLALPDATGLMNNMVSAVLQMAAHFADYGARSSE